ncbi:MAG: hypothetical protein PVG07_07320 [Acidobacteriota bacterium]|jgi:hypothetical protein
MKTSNYKLWMIPALAALALAFALPAQAANQACFDWDCSDNSGSPYVCDFDAGCTQLDSDLWKYRWDFGDGSGIVLTGSEEIQHSYDCDPSCDAGPEVELTVIPLSESSFSVECEILLFNTYGPPLPTLGTCPDN